MINIDKYRVAANIRDYHIVTKLIFLRIIIKIYDDKAVILCKNVSKSVETQMFKIDILTFWC